MNAREARNADARAAVGTRPGTLITAPVRSVGVNPALRHAPLKGAPGPIRKVRALPMTATMRSGDGTGRSLWTASPTLSGLTATIGHDPKWSATVREL